MKPQHLLAALAFGAAALPCLAQDAPPAVRVAATRDPVQKSYRKIVKGMELFEKLHALAPEAPLRFRLLPRQSGVRMQDIVLKVLGDSQSALVPVAADNSFVLERQQWALDEDAQVIPNRKAGSMTWRADIVTPGLPPGTRRLGDLRLECRVGMEAGLISNRGFWAGLLRSPKPEDCDVPQNSIYLFFADRPLFGVTLSDGARSEQIAMADLYAGYKSAREEQLATCDCQVLLERTYFVPLWDRSWSDDTLVSFDYMDAAGNAAPLSGRLQRGGSAPELSVVPGQSTGAELAAQAKPRRKVELPNGYQSWMYAVQPEQPAQPAPGQPAPYAELVVLLDPSGLVRKARLRQPPQAAATPHPEPKG